MNLKEAAILWGVSHDTMKKLIKDGCRLPVSKRAIVLKARRVGNSYDVSDENLDAFIAQFEKEEAGRHPPVAVRRDLLVESQHRCAICRQQALRFEFHHMLKWEVVKHHDPSHMLVLCGSDHNACEAGAVDYQSQQMYKTRLQKPVYIPGNLDEPKVMRERDVEALTRLLSLLGRPLVDLFFEQASYTWLPTEFIEYWENAFSEALRNPHFHLYDTTANRFLNKYVHHVNKIMIIADDWMDPTLSGKKLVFADTISNLGRFGIDKAINDFRKETRSAFAAYREFYAYLRTNYLELNFDKINSNFFAFHERNEKSAADMEQRLLARSRRRVRPAKTSTKKKRR